MQLILKHKYYLFVTALTILGTILHFYNLNWGAPFYFHPDERNIASAISQLRFPEQMNPNFFAYGSFPIYVVFFTGIISNSMMNHPINMVSFEQAIIIGRIYSAIFATALIPLLYILGQRLHDKRTGVIAATFVTLSTGFIQFAHFGTFELWLTFFTILLFWLCIKILHARNIFTLLALGLVCGILVATKISHVVIVVLPFMALLVSHIKNTKNAHHKIVRVLFFIQELAIIAVGTLLVYFITNPFVVLDFKSFLASMQYESSVGLNTLPVFYTQGFYETIPVLYQFVHIYPFLINPLMTILLIPSFLYLLLLSIRSKNMQYLLLLGTFVILFASQSFLFIKWTRYMVPTLPFLYLIIALAITHILFTKRITLKKSLHTSMRVLVIIIFLICTTFSFSYFISAFIQPDTRIAAATFAKQSIPSDAAIFSETYDIGITPFNGSFQNIHIFNTYDLDSKSLEYNEQTLRTALERSEYIILPSQRVLQTRLNNPQRYPIGNRFYTSLLNGSLSFTKKYETSCDIYCQIAYLGDPVYHFEQTTNVFDRPTVFILKRETL